MTEVNLVAVLALVALAAVAIILIAQFLFANQVDLSATGKAAGMVIGLVIGLATLAVTVLGSALASRPVAMHVPIAAALGPGSIDDQPMHHFRLPVEAENLLLQDIPIEFHARVREHLPNPLPVDEEEREQSLQKALRDSGVEQYARYQGIWPLKADSDQRAINPSLTLENFRNSGYLTLRAAAIAERRLNAVDFAALYPDWENTKRQQLPYPASLQRLLRGFDKDPHAESNPGYNVPVQIF